MIHSHPSTRARVLFLCSSLTLTHANALAHVSRWRIICPSYVGSPYGSTSPLSVNPATQTVYGPDFPQITPAEMAIGHANLLRSLGIEKVLCLWVYVVANMFGRGMQRYYDRLMHAHETYKC